jgi:hypothetical protein
MKNASTICSLIQTFRKNPEKKEWKKIQLPQNEICQPLSSFPIWRGMKSKNSTQKRTFLK